MMLNKYCVLAVKTKINGVVYFQCGGSLKVAFENNAWFISGGMVVTFLLKCKNLKQLKQAVWIDHA